MSKFGLYSASILMLGTPAVAGNVVQVFQDRAQWEAAIAAATTESVVTQDFNEAPLANVADGETVDLGNLEVTRTASPTGGGSLSFGERPFGTIDGTRLLDGISGNAPHDVIDITFDGNEVFAFGGDFLSPFSQDGIGLRVSGELVLLDFIEGGSQGFAGLIFDGTVDVVQIVGNPAQLAPIENYSADNFAYAVPNPGTMAVLSLGGLTAARRRR